ncbi:helix-turn-helix domain-containing protein [Streptomyces sp. P9(2023)]|uniref:helix-turn-helix domain-containing protein n=1 Tax=Streptomyces sp. P9(2023) TaxID=3064394 RepID=UPI0037DC7BC5
MTRAEVADLLRVSLTTVDRLAADGTLRRHKPSSKRNGRVLFSAAQVNRLITSSKTR